MLHALKIAETLRAEWQKGPLKHSFAFGEALLKANPFLAVWTSNKVDPMALAGLFHPATFIQKQAEFARTMLDALSPSPATAVENDEAPASNIVALKPTAPSVSDAEPTPSNEKRVAKIEPVFEHALATNTKPTGLDSPLNGEPDDLTLIKGIGPKVMSRLNDLGIFHFSQIAAWTASEKAWVEAHLGMPGKVIRGDWAGKASRLTDGLSEAPVATLAS